MNGRRNYCSVCNRVCTDAEALASHRSSHSHRARQAEYEADPASITGPYSRRLAEDIRDDLPAGAGSGRLLEEVYEEYCREGRRGGIVYLQATRFGTLDQLGAWMHDAGMCTYAADGRISRRSEGPKETAALPPAPKRPKVAPINVAVGDSRPVMPVVPLKRPPALLRKLGPNKLFPQDDPEEAPK